MEYPKYPFDQPNASVAYKAAFEAEANKIKAKQNYIDLQDIFTFERKLGRIRRGARVYFIFDETSQRRGIFQDDFIATFEKFRDDSTRDDTYMFFSNVQLSTSEQQLNIINNSKQQNSNTTNVKANLTETDFGRYKEVYYINPPATFAKNIALLPHAQLKDPSGNVLPPITIDLQGHLASYFRKAKPKQVKKGEKPEMTHEPQGLPQTHTKEGQQQVRQAIKERQEQQDEEALANARMLGGRRKTKKRLSKKRRHTSRK